MSRHVGVYCTLVALVAALFFLTTQQDRSRESPTAVRHATEPSRTVTVSEYFTDLEHRLARFRQKTGYTIKLVEVYGVAAQNMDVVATEQFDQLQREHPESKAIVVVVVDITGGGAAIKTSENLRDPFPNAVVEKKIMAMLQGRSQIRNTERVVHLILEHLNLWFYVLEPSKTSMYLVRYPTAEMILLVFAPIFGMLTGISSIAFTRLRYLRPASRFWVCGVIGVCVVMVFVIIVRQPGGIYPGMFGYALGIGFLVSGIVGLLKRFWLYETFKGRQSGGWWSGPVHFWNG